MPPNQPVFTSALLNVTVEKFSEEFCYNAMCIYCIPFSSEIRILKTFMCKKRGKPCSWMQAAACRWADHSSSVELQASALAPTEQGDSEKVERLTFLPSSHKKNCPLLWLLWLPLNAISHKIILSQSSAITWDTLSRDEEVSGYRLQYCTL